MAGEVEEEGADRQTGRGGGRRPEGGSSGRRVCESERERSRCVVRWSLYISSREAENMGGRACPYYTS